MSTKIWVIAGICLGLMLAVANDGLAKDSKVLLGQGVDAYSRIRALPASTWNNTGEGTMFYADSTEPANTAYMQPVDIEPLDKDGDGYTDKVVIGYRAFGQQFGLGEAWNTVLLRSVNTDGTGAANHTVIGNANLADLQAFDVDGNGTTDGVLIAVNAIGYGITVYTAHPDGSAGASWSPWPFFFYPGRQTTKLALVKLSNALDQIVMTSVEGGNAALIAYNDADIGFPPVANTPPFYQDTSGSLGGGDIMAIDKNNDGTTDNIIMARNPAWYAGIVMGCFYHASPTSTAWTLWDFYNNSGDERNFIKLASSKVPGTVDGSSIVNRILVGFQAYGGSFVDEYKHVDFGFPPKVGGISVHYDPSKVLSDLNTLDLNGDGTTDRILIAGNITGPQARVDAINYSAWTVAPFTTRVGEYIVRVIGIDPDNCPTVANPTQADCDNDGIGDACDTSMPPAPTVTCALVPAGNGGFYSVQFSVSGYTTSISADIDGVTVKNWDVVKLTHSDTNYVKTNRMAGFNGLHINTNGPGTLTVTAKGCGTTTCQAFSAQHP